MSLLNQELYEALISANADDDKAKKAAAVIGSLKSDFKLVKFMIGINTAGILIIIKLILDLFKMIGGTS